MTPSLEPVIPFPNPPTHEPTIEVQEFPTDNLEEIQPYNSYMNHLYIYPKHLNYENQKIFGRARNIVCNVELRDSDAEGAQPLKVIYSRACQGTGHWAGVLTDSANTVVLHHNTFPEWGDEFKVSRRVLWNRKKKIFTSEYNCARRVSCSLVQFYLGLVQKYR